MTKAHLADVQRAIAKGRMREARYTPNDFVCESAFQALTPARFDREDCFLLENWRVGLTLRDKPPREAIKLIRATGVIGISPHDSVAVEWYKKRRTRLGLKTGTKKV